MTKVRLSASRQPYMRAGIAIGARGVFTVVERDDIAAEQWLALLSDPVVQVAISNNDGETWASPSDEERERAVSSIREAITPASVPVTVGAADGDLTGIEAIFAAAGVSGIGALGTRVEQLLQIEGAYRADQRKLFDQGFADLDALIEAWAAGRVALAALADPDDKNSTADRQGGAPAEVVPPPAGDGEGQGAPEGDKTAAPADQAEKPAPAGKARPARKTHTKPAGE